MTPAFLTHLLDIPGACSPAVKASHWRTWQRAQAELIAASGAVVEITVIADERSPVVFPDKAEL